MAAPSVTESQVFAALRAWLQTVVEGVDPADIVKGVINRVPEPGTEPGSPAVVMTPLFYPRTSTNVSTYEDPGGDSFNQIETEPSDFNIQLDSYGPVSGNNAKAIQAAWNSGLASDYFRANLPGACPLFAEDPRLIPLTSGEMQYEQRWSLTVHLQINPAFTFAQEFFRDIETGIIEVDAAYPIS